MNILQAGSHIKVKRFGYTHHGIYIGGGQVVHYNGFSEMFNKGEIAQTTLEEFLGNETHFDIVMYSNSDIAYSQEEIVNRALSRVGEDDYNLLFNNCEHFACWCVTGKHKSQQVNSVLNKTTTIALTYASYQVADSAKQAMYVASAVSGLGKGNVMVNCAKGAVVGSALASSTGIAAGAVATTLGLSAAAVATAPVSLPMAALAGAGMVVGGILGGLFD